MAPWLDERGVLRVGGRLANANKLTFEQKYPLLLHSGHPMTEFMMSWAHIHNLHAAQTVLLSFVRQTFWPIRGKILANKIVHKCLTCSRMKPVPFSQMMGDLPEDRVSELKRPFPVTSVDFAGPFVVHYKGRGSRTTKVYLAVFVCQSTKAVHLDLVESLDTESFLNCLRRFVGRHGAPYKILSDNLSEILFSLESTAKIHAWCRDNFAIQWKFIPPRTPHFGGLHEAAVKSAKNHIMKVVGASLVTIFELLTVLALVESVLNSRPLVPLSINPNDGEP